MIISVHVPKCAGTSFKSVLKGVFGERLWDNYGTIFNREQARAGLIPAGTACIHGHFLADSFDALFPGSPTITFVRHPVERVVSHYQFFLRHPDPRDDCCRAVHERSLTLREFAELEWMQNQSTRYFQGRDVADFAFVGISERFAESLCLLEDALGCRVFAPEVRKNSNPDRTQPFYGLSPYDYAFILERNEADFAWYEDALDRHEEKICDTVLCVA